LKESKSGTAATEKLDYSLVVFDCGTAAARVGDDGAIIT
jgi:hypothetical protein